MSAGAWGFIGVVVGGLLTLFGPVISEMIRTRQQSKAREAERDADRREFNRLAADAAALAASELQTVYYAYESTTTADDAREQQLRAAVSAFDKACGQLANDALKDLLRQWQQAAENWVTGAPGSQLLESRAFRAAMDACGVEQRKYL